MVHLAEQKQCTCAQKVEPQNERWIHLTAAFLRNAHTKALSRPDLSHRTRLQQMRAASVQLTHAKKTVNRNVSPLNS